jgi:hypothetical protein
MSKFNWARVGRENLCRSRGTEDIGSVPKKRGSDNKRGTQRSPRALPVAQEGGAPKSGKFYGSFADLQKFIAQAPCIGSWRNLGNHKQFVASNGAILNWWQSTATITFHGDPDEALVFSEWFHSRLALTTCTP